MGSKYQDIYTQSITPQRGYKEHMHFFNEFDLQKLKFILNIDLIFNMYEINCREI